MGTANGLRGEGLFASEFGLECVAAALHARAVKVRCVRPRQFDSDRPRASTLVLNEHVTGIDRTSADVFRLDEANVKFKALIEAPLDGALACQSHRIIHADDAQLHIMGRPLSQIESDACHRVWGEHAGPVVSIPPDDPFRVG